MKANLSLTIAAAGLFLTASLSSFAIPVVGTYYAQRINPGAGAPYDLLGGHVSESWAGGGARMVGDVLLAQSLNGLTLGSQWEFRGATIGSVTQIYDHRTGGNGDVAVHIVYNTSAATFAIANGSWGSGNGTLSNLSIDETLTYRNNSLLTFRQNWTGSGAFTSAPGYTLYIDTGNGARIGNSPNALPAGFPGFLGGTTGEWNNLDDLTVRIVPEPSSVAAMASGLLGLVGLARRRRA